MRTTKLLIVTIALVMAYGNANAQFGIQRAVQRGVERAVEKKAEEKAEEAINKAVEKPLEKAEEQRARGEAELGKAIDKAQKAQEEADAKVANIPSEIPEVGNSPYTPSESEYAFFAMKKGAVQVIATKDAKGKITQQMRNTVKGITGAKNAFAINYESEILDAKGKPVKDSPTLNYRVVVKDGIMYLDMKEMFRGMEGTDGYEVDMQVSGTAMKIPSNLSVGQSLEDAGAKVRIGVINCSAITTERKCLAIEDVKVEAGTFRCYKITQKTNAVMLGIRRESTTLTWYAKGVGTVKVENYDKNGNLQSSQELISNK